MLRACMCVCVCQTVPAAKILRDAHFVVVVPPPFLFERQIEASWLLVLVGGEAEKGP